MDDHNDSPWDEINPPRTALAQRPERPCALSRPSDRLSPAPEADFRRELTACLVLTAPVGMTEDDRTAWLIAAYATLSHLPADLLAEGCQQARKEADHPSKIVPIITKTTEEALSLRRKNAAAEIPDFRLPAPKPEPLEVCTPEQAAAIMAEFGLRRNPLDTIA